MTTEELLAWRDFLAGHWQRELPLREGSYFTAAYDGHPAGLIGIYWNGGAFVSTKTWGGWWWSEPTPKLPKPPPWPGDVK